jgi:cysteine desulfurase
MPDAEINGPMGDAKAPHILNIYFPGHAAQDLLTRFDRAGLAVSSGSACRSRAVESSYVIEALGHSKERAASSVRFSLGKETTKRQIAAAAKIIQKTLLLAE